MMLKNELLLLGADPCSVLSVVSRKDACRRDVIRPEIVTELGFTNQ